MLIEVIVATVGGTITAVSLGGMWLTKRLREADLTEENGEREHELKLERAHRTPEEIAADLKEKEIAARADVERERIAAEEKERKRRTAEAKEAREEAEKRAERERRQNLPEITTPKSAQNKAQCPYCHYIAKIEGSPDMLPSGSYWFEHLVNRRESFASIRGDLAKTPHDGPCTIHTFVLDDGTQMPWRVCTSCSAEWFEKSENEENSPRKRKSNPKP